MTSNERKRVARRDFVLAAMAIVAGLTVTGASLLQPTLWTEPQRYAQAQTTQPDQSGETTAPAESKPGDARPTTPSPQPARPDANAQKKGAKPALPPAPAEKFAPSVDAK